MFARELWQQAKQQLLSVMDEEQAANEARWMLEHLGVRLWLDDAVSEEVNMKLTKMLVSRLRNQPLAYILGETQFMGLPISVTSDVLIPRNDSECVVEAALSVLPEGAAARVADIGTGSGALAIAIAHFRPQTTVDAVDISLPALAVAEKNAKNLHLGSRMRFIHSDLMNNLCEKYQLIISNPPYVTLQEMDEVDPEVLCEPRVALTDEGDGLSFYRKLVVQGIDHLDYGGHLVFEIGYRQAEDVMAMMREVGFLDVRYGCDGGGRPRYVIGKKGEMNAD